MCIRWLINFSDSTEMHGATIRFKDRGILHLKSRCLWKGLGLLPSIKL